MNGLESVRTRVVCLSDWAGWLPCGDTYPLIEGIAVRDWIAPDRELSRFPRAPINDRRMQNVKLEVAEAMWEECSMGR